MHLIIKITIAFALSAIGLGAYQVPQPRPDMSSTTPTDKPYEAIGGFGQAMADIYRFVPPVTTTTLPAPVYEHGNCSWLPAVALQAGWQPEQLITLTKIVLRESGCCPRRIGGQKVLPDCTPNGFAETTHLSDSGLTMINGVHWKPDHAQYDGLICKQMKICTQEPLLDPLTNLQAARLIYIRVGWSAWNMCHSTKSCK
jgi:hypothetical protein